LRSGFGQRVGDTVIFSAANRDDVEKA
jgi:hypothetical protein